MEAIKRGPRPQTLKILELRRQGLMHKEIAALLGCSKDTVKDACRKYGLTENHSVTETEAEKTVIDAGFDYVGGFTNTKGKVTMRCRSCGGVFERYYDGVRNYAHGKSKHTITCPHCWKNEVEEYRKKKREPKEREAQMRAAIAAENRSLRLGLQLARRLANHVCKNCGEYFCIEATGYNSEQYCSKACQKRYVNRIKSEKRIDKLKSRRHDTNITLEKLFKRDGGVCYICGNECDWSDITEKDGTMIAGDRYPSIDHVKPVSKGGTHTWDNIKLACRHCNTLKGWK